MNFETELRSHRNAGTVLESTERGPLSVIVFTQRVIVVDIFASFEGSGTRGFPRVLIDVLYVLTYSVQTEFPPILLAQFGGLFRRCRRRVVAIVSTVALSWMPDFRR